MITANVVKFSPVPEYQDAVTVGLLVRERCLRLVWDPSFPKVGCIAPDVDKALLHAWFEGANEILSGLAPEKGLQLLKSWNAQISIGSEFPIAESDVDQAVSMLLKLVTGRHRLEDREATERRRTRIETAIDETISEYGGRGVRFRRRPRLADYLSGATVSALGTSEIRVARVVESPRTLVVIDGLVLDQSQKSYRRKVSEKISFEYFSLGKVRHLIELNEQRKLMRVAMVYGYRASTNAYDDFITHKIAEEADLVFDPRHPLPAEADKFRALMEEARGPQLLQ